MEKENAQLFLTDMFRKFAPKDMQHKFDQPDIIQKMIERYCTEAKETRTKTAKEITSVTDKFVPHISYYPITTLLIVPATLGVYSGLTNPLDFLQRFEGVVSTYNWNESVACRVFPMVLQGLGREWFHNLSTRSIAGFIDPREFFLLQFQNLLPQKKTHIECHDIKQGFKETLGGLLKRYVYECQKIPNLHEDKKIFGFVHAINQQKHPTLVRRLHRDVPQTFAKVMQETYDYICWERSWRDDYESYRDGNQDNYCDNNRGSGYHQSNNNGGYQRNDRQCNNGDNGNNGYHNRDCNSTRKWSNDSFNIIQALSKTPKEILMKERVAKTFPDPPPLSENNRRDKSKFCVFHDDYDHDTNRCCDLVELNADATTQGKLDHLLNDKASNTTDAMIVPSLTNTPKTPNVSANVQQERKAPAVKILCAKVVGMNENFQEIKVINIVQISNVAQKRKAEETLDKWQFAPITFPPVQDCGLSDEPIIISCKIADSAIIIKKVHIDTESSVDVMYEQCFNKLQENIKAKLLPTAVSLSGFSGEATWPLGQLELCIELTDEKDARRVRKEKLNLYVMRNILLGGTALCKLGVISSTIHGMVKFATSKGIATVTSAEFEPVCSLITAQENVGVEGHQVVTNCVIPRQSDSGLSKTVNQLAIEIRCAARKPISPITCNKDMFAATFVRNMRSFTAGLRRLI
ncbi:uncharacterized protein [Rutidosis leptorrhynchoides]|uniref:uncharacterized protein n=1 Tax=Rutidosis leptorrhynchoides TaxID=125765 RepID=UPI003A9A253B